MPLPPVEPSTLDLSGFDPTSRHVNRLFKGEEVLLDGQAFLACHFEDCRFNFAGKAPFLMHDCETDSWKFTVSHDASRTMDFLKFVMAQPGGALVLARTFPGSSWPDAPNTSNLIRVEQEEPPKLSVGWEEPVVTPPTKFEFWNWFTTQAPKWLIWAWAAIVVGWVSVAIAWAVILSLK